MRVAEDEKPLKIYIFTPEDQTYRQTAVIEGTGTGFYSVAYTDMDGDGYMELLVGWKVNAELQALTVYSLSRGMPEELMRSNYVKYAVTNLDRDQMQELVVIRSDEDGEGTADYYRWQDQGLVNAVLRADLQHYGPTEPAGTSDAGNSAGRNGSAVCDRCDGLNQR